MPLPLYAFYGGFFHTINMSKNFSSRQRLPSIKSMLPKEIKKTIPICAVVCFLIVCLVSNPMKYIKSIQSGLLLFGSNVAPALFPFFFFTKILTGLGFADYLGKVGGRPFQKLYNCPKCGSYVFTMSLVSGYPIGSKLLADLYASKVITTREAQSICSFTSTSGPLFVVGTIGSLMLGSASLGYVCFCAHIIGALLNGLIYRQKKSASSTTFSVVKNVSHDTLLSDSMTSSIMSVLAVGGYIAISSMIVDVLIDLKIVQFLAVPISSVLSFFHAPPALASGLVISFVEITRGTLELTKCGVEMQLLLPYICAMLSFGGVSIILQSVTFLNCCGIKTSYFLITKTTQAIISFCVTYLLCLLL